MARPSARSTVGSLSPSISRSTSAIASRVEPARAHLESALTIHPGLSAAHVLFARACLVEGRLDDGIAHAAAADPGDYDAVVDSLKVLLSTAELCAASRVQRIEEEFGITHIDVYACVEGFFSLPCPCGEKHVLPAYHAEEKYGLVHVFLGDLDESERPPIKAIMPEAETGDWHYGVIKRQKDINFLRMCENYNDPCHVHYIH